MHKAINIESFLQFFNDTLIIINVVQDNRFTNCIFENQFRCMRYFFIILLTICGPKISDAQELPLTFENNQDLFTGFGNCVFYTQADPIDSSNTVGVIQNSGNNLFEGVFLDLSPNANFDNSKLIGFDFYSNTGQNTTIQVKFEGSDSGFGDAFLEATVPGNGWSNVQLDFSQANIIGQSGMQSISGNFSRIAIFVGPNQFLSGTFFIDNIEGGESTPLVFDELIWSDEFNDYSGSPDPTKWHHQVIPIINGNSWANGEEQHYTANSSNSYVSNGTLKIKAIKQNYIYNGVSKSYTSARLNSKFAFKYGRVDVRAKLPSSNGTWPAIWTLGANINEVGNYFGNAYGSVGWPDCGEIDIMEQNGWNKNITYAYMHYRNSSTGDYENTGTTTPISDSSDSFHLYSLIWTENIIQILLDDMVFFERQNTDDIPYDNLHYILLNIAMGGNLGGEIPANFTEDVMEIDYVRVYQQSNLGLDQSVVKTFTIYPNPTSNLVQIKLRPIDLISNLSVVDATGKLVIKRNDINTTKITLDVSSLNSGVYIVRIQTSSNILTKRLIIK